MRVGVIRVRVKVRGRVQSYRINKKKVYRRKSIILITGQRVRVLNSEIGDDEDNVNDHKGDIEADVGFEEGH